MYLSRITYARHEIFQMTNSIINRKTDRLTFSLLATADIGSGYSFVGPFPLSKCILQNVTILRTIEWVTTMTCSNPPLPSLILSNCTRKMEKLNWITIRISFPRLRVLGIVSTSTTSTSFCCNHCLYSVILVSELSGVFSPKYATCGSTTYSRWVRRDRMCYSIFKF